jgi:dienelactone hydrolase
MRRHHRTFFISLLCIAGSALGASTAAEEVVEISSRPGQTIRMLIAKPAAQAQAAVVLLAGGHGHLAIARDGKLGWGSGNQVIRTRSNYAKSGFVTLVPDVAPDLVEGSGVKPGYRWSEAHARDLGAVIKHARSLAKRVYLVGTSRAALSVTNAAARLSGAEAPDAIVITSGMIADLTDKQPSAERNVGRLDRIKQPVLLVFHEKDACSYTPASSAARAKSLFNAAAKVDVVILSGGSPAEGDPCEARSPHGFLGLDDKVVATITQWLGKLSR